MGYKYLADFSKVLTFSELTGIYIAYRKLQKLTELDRPFQILHSVANILQSVSCNQTSDAASTGIIRSGIATYQIWNFNLAYYCTGCQTDPEIAIKTTLTVVRSQVQTVLMSSPEALG